MKKYAKQSFFENVDGLIDCLSMSDSIAYWQLMNKLIKTKTTTQIPPLFDNESNTLVYSDADKAEVLNSYFCSIADLKDENIDPPHFPLRTNGLLSSIELSREEILDILQILKLGKASGLDCVSHHLLKFTAQTVSIPLEKLFNLSLSRGTFPEQWKIALVIPLFKNGDKTNTCNYRPIALLSAVGKVFERVVFKHVFNFFLNNNLFYKFQSGFTPGHSTIHQLIEIYHKICLALEEEKHICIVFCDISKAFDHVWLKGLVKKSKSYGLQGNF